MNHLISHDPLRPLLRRWPVALFVAVNLGLFLPQPAAAQAASNPQEVRIAVTSDDLRDPRRLAALRTRIDIAAQRLCGSGGVAGIYRNGTRRCRESVAGEAERQLQAQLAIRIAARHAE